MRIKHAKYIFQQIFLRFRSNFDLPPPGVRDISANFYYVIDCTNFYLYLSAFHKKITNYTNTVKYMRYSTLVIYICHMVIYFKFQVSDLDKKKILYLKDVMKKKHVYLNRQGIKCMSSTTRVQRNRARVRALQRFQFAYQICI